MTDNNEREQLPEEPEIKIPKTFHELKKIATEWDLSIPLRAPFTPDDVNELIPLLRLALPSEAIQQSFKDKTGKGYDTTGYSYQAHIDRINWVFGLTNWQWELQNKNIETAFTSTNKQKFICSGQIVVRIGYPVLNPDSGKWEFLTVHEVPPYPTDHESMEKGSAEKGMLTKGIKRATAVLGVGADAWLGLLDDDLITGITPGEEMAGVVSGGARQQQQRSEARPEAKISEKDFDYLSRLMTKKGFTFETLRTWIEGRTDGRIDKAAADLTNLEFEEIKQQLFTIPQNKTIHDFQDIRQSEHSQQHDEGDPRNQNPPIDDGTLKIEPGEPQTLDELILASDETIRTMAKRVNFNMPPTLSDTNKRPLCKALAAILKIPA